MELEGWIVCFEGTTHPVLKSSTHRQIRHGGRREAHPEHDGATKLPGSVRGGSGHPAVSAHDLSKVYGARENEVIALDHVSLTFQPATFTAIMGPPAPARARCCTASRGSTSQPPGPSALAMSN
jgi:hypothetical protein